MEWRNLTIADCRSIAELCRDTIPSRYYVTEKALEEKLFKHRCFDKDSSYSIWNKDDCVGFVGVKIPDAPQLFPDTAWLSIVAVREELQRNGYGSLLLKKACESLRQKGIRKMIVGQDFSCFFSGLPEVTPALCGFFVKNGFTVSGDFRYYDLEGNVQNNAWLEEFPVRDFEPAWSVMPYAGEEEAFLAFLDREFPDRWKFEVQCALKEGKTHEEMLLLWDCARKEVCGFCMLGSEPDGRGKLGPIGIAQKVRGNGIGAYLLCKSLLHLQHLGKNRVNIDWTVLTEFYGQFDFVPERTFCPASKEW